MSDLIIATNTSYPRFDPEIMDFLYGLATIPSGNGLAAHDPDRVYTMDLHDLVLDDSAAIDDTIRGMLALKSFTLSAEQGIPVITTDFASPKEWKRIVHTLSGGMVTIIDQEKTDAKTIAEAREHSVITARNRGAKIVGLTEPEKFLAMPFFNLFADQIYRGEADLVIPHRIFSSFIGTYPFQQFARETATNLVLNSLLKQRNLIGQHEPFDDFMGGARVIGERALGLFTDVRSTYKLPKEHKMYGSYSHLMIPVIRARQQGLRVVGHDVPYLHPYIQTSLETHPSRASRYNRKRDEQSDVVLFECGIELGLPREEIQREIELSDAASKIIFRDLELSLHRKTYPERMI